MAMTVAEKMAHARSVKYDKSLGSVTRQQEIKDTKDRETEAATEAAKKTSAYVKARPKRLKSGDSRAFKTYTLTEWNELDYHTRDQMHVLRDTDPNNHFALSAKGGRPMPKKYRGALNYDQMKGQGRY